jgi:glycosyltransferase involved in cell wall biosynthesis
VEEIVEEWVTGFIVRNLKEMAETINSPKLQNFDRKRCAERARERFSTLRFIDEHEKLYAEILRPLKSHPTPQLAII